MDMDTLKAECLACTRCELCATRTNVVFGQGVPDAEVLFVGCLLYTSPSPRD